MSTLAEHCGQDKMRQMRHYKKERLIFNLYIST